jgi:hypothetical protein
MVTAGLWALCAAAVCAPIDADLTGDRWTPKTANAFRAELAVEDSRGGRCLGDDALVRVVWQGNEPIGVSVVWKHGATERQLRRVFDPSAVDPAGLMLALSAVVSELLGEARESWPAPPAAAVEAPVAPPPPPARTLAVMARLGGELYFGGATLGGADLAFRAVLPARLELSLFAGGRAALLRSTALGTVNMTTVGGGLGLLLLLVEGGPLRLSLLAESAVSHAWVTAQPVGMATGRSTTGVTVDLRGGLELAFRPGVIWWALGLSAGAPLRGLVLTDSAGVVTAVHGIEGALTLAGGLGW